MSVVLTAIAAVYINSITLTIIGQDNYSVCCGCSELGNNTVAIYLALMSLTAAMLHRHEKYHQHTRDFILSW